MSNHSQSRSLPADLYAPLGMVSSWRARALPIAGIFTVGAIIGAIWNWSIFLRAYLTGYMLFWGISMGAMALVMVQHLTGGKWSVVNRRIFEAASRNMYLMWVLFLPILIGAKSIYAWMTAGPHSALIEEASRAAAWKHVWMNYPFWIARWFIYFAIWSYYVWKLNRWSIARDADSRDSLLFWQTKFENLSGFGLVVYSLTLTAASVDWVMSLDITWFSTIYGLLYLVGQGLSAIAFALIILTLLSREEPMGSVLRLTELHDNGKLLFAFVMLFAYIAFSQFLIIWCGNLPEEISWYSNRIHGGWGFIAVGVAVFHFCLPWLVLLSRDIKRHVVYLRRLAYFMVFMRFVDLFWNIEPNFSYNPQGKLVSVNFIPTEQLTPHFHFPWQFAVVPVAIGAWWFIAFCSELRKVPLIPINDPQIHEVLEPEHAHAAV